MAPENDLAHSNEDAAELMGTGIDMSQSRQTDVLRAVGSPHVRGERKFPRRRLIIVVDYEAEEEAHQDLIQNISGGGVFIETPKPLPVGSDISMTFKLSDSDDPVKFKGEVVRNETNGMGVQFKWERGMF